MPFPVEHNPSIPLFEPVTPRLEITSPQPITITHYYSQILQPIIIQACEPIKAALTKLTLLPDGPHFYSNMAVSAFALAGAS
jgi:hypothetical protein